MDQPERFIRVIIASIEQNESFQKPFLFITHLPQATSVQAVRREMRLHLALKLLKQGLEFVHISLLSGPFDSEAFSLIWLGNLCVISVTHPYPNFEKLKTYHVKMNLLHEAQVVSNSCSYERYINGTDVINKLMRSTAVVLQDIEIFGTGCYGDFLRDGLYFQGSCQQSQFLEKRRRLGGRRMASKVRILLLGYI